MVAGRWPLRSMLFVPGHRIDWVRSVKRFDPDAVVLDLEDAVPKALKTQTRRTVRDAIEILRGLEIDAFVRINRLDEGGSEDVLAVAAPGLSGVMLPKARDAKQVLALDGLLSFAEGQNRLEHKSIAILPLPETAQGLADARQLAAASDRVRGLVTVVGGPISGDVARAMGIVPTDHGIEQHFLWSKIVLDSRAGGAMFPMASIIGTKLDDHAAVRRLIQLARSFGYSGAVLIHPSHVAIANDTYTPSRDDVAYYQGLLQAMRDAEAKGQAAVNYEGQMVDYAMIPYAEEVVREAARRKVPVL